jgi:transcriptional regulator with XRE-family HTH domain
MTTVEPILATVAQARLAAGLSRRELADRAGVSESAVSALENGAPPTVRTLDRVAAVLNLTVTLAPAAPRLPRSRLGPNDIAECPSRSCMVWHQAHGYDHDCRRGVPVRSRMVRRPLRDLPETRRFPQALPEEVA